jgi:hypothetical protein
MTLQSKKIDSQNDLKKRTDKNILCNQTTK